MLTDGFKMLGGYADNLNIINGDVFPTTDLRVGRLFYKTGGGAGLHVYNPEGWTVIGGSSVTPDGIVFLTEIQTLTNKTLASPQLNTPLVDKPVVSGLVEIKVEMLANNIAVDTGAVFTKTITTATTLTVSGAPPAGKVASFILKLTNGGAAVVTWWAGIKWEGGTAPTLTAAGVDNLGFYSDNGGTTWEGFLLSADSK